MSQAKKPLLGTLPGKNFATNIKQKKQKENNRNIIFIFSFVKNKNFPIFY